MLANMVRGTELIQLLKVILIIFPRSERVLLHEATWLMIELSNSDEADIIHALVNSKLFQMAGRLLEGAIDETNIQGSFSFEENVLWFWSNVLGDSHLTMLDGYEASSAIAKVVHILLQQTTFLDFLHKVVYSKC